MLKKDLIELCLLNLLAQRDWYGYEMLSRVHSAFPDTNESVVYALLRGLNKEGCAETYQGQTSAGPVRKYYRLTAGGQERFQALLTQWRQLAEAMKTMGVE